MSDDELKFLMRHDEAGHNEVDRVAGVLNEVELAKKDRESYFDLIPAEYQYWVRRLAEENYPFFNTEFSSLELFLDEFSKNWLAKVKVFELLARENEFKEIDPNTVTTAELNTSVMACLTRSASYAFIGPGAYDPTGPGAAGMYSKIPFRPTTHPDTETTAGNHLTETPKKNQKLHFLGINTSPLMFAYYRPMEGISKYAAGQVSDKPRILEELHITMELEQTFTGINELTFRPKKSIK